MRSAERAHASPVHCSAAGLRAIVIHGSTGWLGSGAGLESDSRTDRADDASQHSSDASSHRTTLPHVPRDASTATSIDMKGVFMSRPFSKPSRSRQDLQLARSCRPTLETVSRLPRVKPRPRTNAWGCRPSCVRLLQESAALSLASQHIDRHLASPATAGRLLPRRNARTQSELATRGRKASSGRLEHL